MDRKKVCASNMADPRTFLKIIKGSYKANIIKDTTVKYTIHSLLMYFKAYTYVYYMSPFKVCWPPIRM